MSTNNSHECYLIITKDWKIQRVQLTLQTIIPQPSVFYCIADSLHYLCESFTYFSFLHLRLLLFEFFSYLSQSIHSLNRSDLPSLPPSNETT